MTTEDPAKIKEASEKLRNSSMEIGKSIYSQSNEQSSENQEAKPEEAQEAQTEEPKQEEKK